MTGAPVAAPSARPHTFGYRPEIDGLRGVAVLVVVVFHLSRQWLPGGFLGVDVFFVISGYLITTLLLLEKRRAGRIDIPAFWGRRVRRLLPAMLLVVTVVAAVAFAAGDDVLSARLRADLVAAVLYVANWRFILEGQSYFEAFTSASPVLHTWSLAIEEQFYIAWPVLFWVLAAGRRPLVRLATAASAAGLASLWVLITVFDPGDPTRAYFGTDARSHQLLVGVLLAAVLASVHRDRALRLCRRLALPAAILLGASLAVLTDDGAAYYRGGSLLVAAAAAVLLGGLEGGSSLARPLSWRPLVRLGTISYGIYLWHFPVVVFAGEWLGPPDRPWVALVVVTSTLLVSWLSFVLVETPVRRGAGPWSSSRRLVLLVPAASGLVIGIVVALTPAASEAPAWLADVEARPLTTDAPPAEPASQDGDRLRVGLVGDSVLVSAEPGLVAAAEDRDIELFSAAHRGCPIGYEPLYTDDGADSQFNERCEDQVDPGYTELLAWEPDVVLWQDLQSVLARRAPDGELLRAGTDRWEADLVDEWTEVLDRLVDAGVRVVLVQPPLRSQHAPGCDGARRPDRCAEIQRQDATIRSAFRRFAATVEDRPLVSTASLDRVLCPEGMPCPSTLDGIHVRIPGRDQTHFTEDGADWIAPVLLDLVVATEDSVED